ncbi:MAG: VWA domain-containing protein [Acidobacteriota bacterium]
MLALLSTSTAATGIQEHQRPSFESTVERVRVDVIVTDGDGRFVDDLRPEDFLLFEDGVPQKVLSSQLVELTPRATFTPTNAQGTVGDSAAARAGKTAATVPAVSDRTAAETATAAGERSPATASGVALSSDRNDELGAIIFLIDFPGLDRRNKQRFTEAWETLLAETSSLGVPRAAYLLDQAGRLKELVPLTRDVARIRAAAQQVQETPLTRKSFKERLIEADRRIEEFRDDEFSSGEPGDDAPSSDLMEKVKDLEELTIRQEEHARSRYTLKLLTKFAEGLAARRGRTALVWVSSGITLTGSESRGRPTVDPELTEAEPDPELVSMMAALHRIANSANVSIYTVDPSSIQGLTYGVADASTRALPGGQKVTRPDLMMQQRRRRRERLVELRDSLVETAKQTGGKSFIAVSDLGQVLQAIEEDTSRFYLLTYAPPPPYGDGNYHHLRVRVRRSGVKVRARSGYLDLHAEERHARTIEAALALPGAVAELPLAVQAYRKWSADGNPAVQLALSVDRGALTATRSADGRALFDLEIHALVLDDHDQIADRAHEKIHQQIIPAQGASSAPLPTSRAILYTHEWTLEPGSYELRVVVQDSASGKLGAGELEVMVPEPAAAWQPSDLMLFASQGSDTPQPVVGGRLLAGEPAFAYLQVRGVSEATISGEILNGSGTLKLAVLGAVRLVADAVGVHRGALVLPQLLPGDYILQVQLADPQAGKYRLFRSSLHILP